MIVMERLRADHVAGLDLQPAQRGMAPALTLEYGQALVAQEGVAWAAVDDVAGVLGCAGLVEVWRDRAIAWALVTPAALHHWVAVHRLVRDVLRDAPWRRVEMHVDVDHDAAVRWAERLGFVREGRMRAFTTDGRDCYLYARIK